MDGWLGLLGICAGRFLWLRLHAKQEAHQVEGTYEQMIYGDGKK